MVEKGKEINPDTFLNAIKIFINLTETFEPVTTISRYTIMHREIKRILELYKLKKEEARTENISTSQQNIVYSEPRRGNPYFPLQRSGETKRYAYKERDYLNVETKKVSFLNSIIVDLMLNLIK
jgi:hypothetical protein